MQKRVLPIALALIIAAAGTLAVAASNYTTKQVMAQAFKGGLLKKVVAGDATDAERTTLLAMLESLAQNKPKKGGADSWKAKTSALLEAAKANDGEKLKAAAACALATTSTSRHKHAAATLALPDLMQAPPQPPPRVTELLETAHREIDEFIHREGRQLHGFVGSDYLAAFAAIRWIHQEHLLAGHAFCEWGCGFGVVTMLASLAGMDACGIEVEPLLAERAEQLAERLEIPCDFAVGSLIPEDADRLVEFVEDIAHIDTDSPAAYDLLGLEIDDFDLIYAYPWPGEERYLEDIFEHYASRGALLLTYHGIEDLRLQRKT